MTKLFISHGSEDDRFVRDLRAMLAEQEQGQEHGQEQGQDGWLDSRALRGGAPPWTEIRSAIEAASGYVVVVSPEALRSKWVDKELCYALKIRDQGDKDKFPIIPLSLDGTRLGVLEEFFGDEPVYVPVNRDAGGVAAAVNAILVAMGKRAAGDVAAIPQPRAEPQDDLVLELTDPRFHERDGKRRVSALAQLVYQPATPGQSEVVSIQPWRLVVPLRPPDASAQDLEANLLKWGRALHAVAMPVAYTTNVMKAWARIDPHARRRFSVAVDDALVATPTEAAIKAAREAAAELLEVPWELLHDGGDYLFQGAHPIRVRRRLPDTRVLDVPVVAPPIRILQVAARSEDVAGSSGDQAGALPLVEAQQALSGLVQLQLLDPPTLPALRAELERARSEKRPYHVIHFDGPAFHDATVGLGGLSFQLPEDTGKPEGRRQVAALTSELGPLLRDHRIPLVFLEAHQNATAGKAAASVASGLLKLGVASVVAMSPGIQAESTRRFLPAFYRALAAGARVGDATLAGQRELKNGSEPRPEGWFPPVLFQEKGDPQLFKASPSEREG